MVSVWTTGGTRPAPTGLNDFPGKLQLFWQHCTYRAKKKPEITYLSWVHCSSCTRHSRTWFLIVDWGFCWFFGPIFWAGWYAVLCHIWVVWPTCDQPMRAQHPASLSNESSPRSLLPRWVSSRAAACYHEKETGENQVASWYVHRTI